MTNLRDPRAHLRRSFNALHAMTAQQADEWRTRWNDSFEEKRPMKHTMTVGELHVKLAGVPLDMPVCVRVALAEGENEITIEDGDNLMGDLRDAYVEHGCGSAPPVLILDGDREPSDAVDAE